MNLKHQDISGTVVIVALDKDWLTPHEANLSFKIALNNSRKINR